MVQGVHRHGEYYEGTQRSRQERPGEVAENSSGTAGIERPQAFAGLSVEIVGTPEMELQGRLHEMMSRWKAIRTKRIPRGLQDFVEEDLEFEIKENNNEKRLVVWNKTKNNKGVLGHGLWNRNSSRHKRKKTPT
ncbi:hypothetical protein Tco_1009771 [Tanacetum coccineum]